MKTLDGSAIDLQQYVTQDCEHELIVIAFWAMWDSPSKKQLLEIDEFYAKWQEDFDVELIAVSMDNGRTAYKLPGFVSGHEWDYTVFSDP
ncbi:MAG: redoxin domain-containing protein, partial [Crocinitomicaceae bacterium]|nr:redoxin domain-containing protein [Crocinitomicaceae bacterium]